MKRRVAIICVIALSVLLILQSIAFFIFTVNWYLHRIASIDPPSKENTFCLDCKHLETKDGVLNDVIENFRLPDHPNKCCNTTSAVLDLIIQQEQILRTQAIIQREAEDQVNLEQAKCDLVTSTRIHGQLKFVRGSASYSDGYKLTWTKSGHQPEHMKHHENAGELEIMTSGEYFVTSHIIYRGKNVDLEGGQFTHSVVHCREGREGADGCKVVIQDGKERCIGGERFEFTSTVSGLVHVGKSDRLFVLSHHNESFIDRENCYLSLHHSYS